MYIPTALLFKIFSFGGKAQFYMSIYFYSEKNTCSKELKICILMRIFNDRNAEKSIFFYTMLYGLCIEMSFHFVILFFNVESGTHLFL